MRFTYPKLLLRTNLTRLLRSHPPQRGGHFAHTRYERTKSMSLRGALARRGNLLLPSTLLLRSIEDRTGRSPRAFGSRDDKLLEKEVYCEDPSARLRLGRDDKNFRKLLRAANDRPYRRTETVQRPPKPSQKGTAKGRGDRALKNQ